MNTNEFKRPINIVSLSLAILGILIGAYFYYQSKQFKEISYQVDPIASKLYDSKNTTSIIHLLDKDSLPITEDVYYIRGKIWNSGNLSILGSDLRAPIMIELKSCKRILDFKIERQYEDSTQLFQLKKIGKNILEVNWRYFDPMNGFSYQIIYLGKADPNFNLKGKILGMSNFQDISLKNKNPLWYNILGYVICLLLGIFSSYLFPSILGKESKLNIVKRIIFLAIIAAFISFIWQFLIPLFSKPTIPF